VAAAARLGISHAEFLGWPHEERALMIALARVERNTGRYGEWLPDATNPGADPNEYSSPLRYVAHGPFTNWAEKAVQDAEAAWRKSAGDGANLNGMFWTAGEAS
jgi:hypothetical protein